MPQQCQLLARKSCELQHVDYPLTEANPCKFLPIGAKLLLLEEKLGREVALEAPGLMWVRRRAHPITLTKAKT